MNQITGLFLLLINLSFINCIRLVADVLTENFGSSSVECKSLLNLLKKEFGKSVRVSEFFKDRTCSPVLIDVPNNLDDKVSPLFMATVDWIRSSPLLTNIQIDWGSEYLSREDEITENNSSTFATIDTNEYDIKLSSENKTFPSVNYSRLMSQSDNRELNGEFIDSIFNDPFWPKMWYLNPKFEQARRMNIYGAWLQGYSGKGVHIAVIDDGIDYNHVDLIRNYDSKASFDINDNDFDPMPSVTWNNVNRHGTRCAGQIAAEANNSNCIVGVAFNSQIGGIRILDGRVVDSSEAAAISFRHDYIDIYSASWGPRDNGQKLDGPGKRGLASLEKAIMEGRNGLGSIYVWAAGNGGRDSDDCNCDGYTSSPYTITVSSTSEKGIIPPYVELCSSVLSSTYSSGYQVLNERAVSTTDIYGGCTNTHSGTSASAPIMAGIIALALEANPKLTWRDVQHIIVESSSNNGLHGEWQTNAAGYAFSEYFGFGLINADLMVRKAKLWENVPERISCAVHVIQNDHHSIPPRNVLKGKLMTNACASSISKLEHVEILLTLDSKRRGDLQIVITSPANTKSTILHFRKADASTSGFYRWPFMSVHFWNENPVGEWSMEIYNKAQTNAYLTQWVMIFHGR
ncbi:hypothetical protein GJ496_004315 [Pomphorhynchus laevis]|nr:hypothetical protein GJ496_004315 [Pomphorhynchus laevis]